MELYLLGFFWFGLFILIVGLTASHSPSVDLDPLTLFLCHWGEYGLVILKDQELDFKASF